MKKVSLRIAAVAAALALAAPAAATNGMRVIGFGPVQNSMGGAAIAAPLDSSTIITNPAGMTALDRRVDLGASVFTPTVKYSADYLTMQGPASASQSSDRAPDVIPTLGAVYKVADKFTVGVAALGTNGLGVDYAAGANGLFGSATLTSYSNFRLAPAVAYRVTDRFSVGVTANLMYAWMKYDVMGAAGVAPRDTAYSYGYGATLGVSYQAPEGVNLSAAYETKSTFQDFEFNLPTGTEKMKFDQPDVASAGVAFRPIQPLLIAADLQWIRWSTTNGKNQPELTQKAADSMPFNMSWSDQTVLKIGAQYDVTKQVQVRAGYNYGSDILDATRAFENIAFPAVAKHHYTVGGGYAFGALTVNAAVQYSPEAKLQGSNTDQYITAYQTSMSQLAFDLGASWKF